MEVGIAGIAMRMLPGLGLLAATLLLTAFGTNAEARRVAFVVGNSVYLHTSRLANPTNDATAMASLFKSAGFDVVEAKLDASNSELRRAIRDFADQVRDADVAVVFYAGHAIEVDGQNYLVPTDALLRRDVDVEDETISLDRIVRILEPARQLRLVILDACRDNPFVTSMQRTIATRSMGRGLARVDPTAPNTLVAFAARAGSTASDGRSKNSPFTESLLKHLTVPGLDLRLALGRVRDDVIAKTGKRQEPFVYGSLGGSEFSLVPQPSRADPVVSAAPAVSPPRDSDAIAARDYEFAERTGTKEAWEAFLTRHPKGFFSDLARANMAKLDMRATEKPAVSVPPAAPNPAVQPLPVPITQPAALEQRMPTTTVKPAPSARSSTVAAPLNAQKTAKQPPVRTEPQIACTAQGCQPVPTNCRVDRNDGNQNRAGLADRIICP